jgi:hypothetical protein
MDEELEYWKEEAARQDELAEIARKAGVVAKIPQKTIPLNPDGSSQEDIEGTDDG